MAASILLKFVNLFVQVFYWLVIIQVVFSFIRPRPYTFWDQIDRLTYTLTEPILAPIRRLLPPTGGLDFSPLVALLLLGVVQRILNLVIIRLFF